jgi:hypothetical protein
MRTPRRLAVLLLSAPLLAGCFSVSTVPVPRTAPERQEAQIRGVVVRQEGGGEEIVDFSSIADATWTPTSVSIVGVLDGSDVPETRLFQISTLSGLRVRQLDAGKTSAIIGGVFLAAAAIISSVVSGTAGY